MVQFYFKQFLILCIFKDQSNFKLFKQEPLIISILLMRSLIISSVLNCSSITGVTAVTQIRLSIRASPSMGYCLAQHVWPARRVVVRIGVYVLLWVPDIIMSHMSWWWSLCSHILIFWFLWVPLQVSGRLLCLQ